MSGYQVNSEKGTSYIYDNSGNKWKENIHPEDDRDSTYDFEELKKQPVHYYRI